MRQEYIDFEYLDQLNEKELDWLDKFAGEYYGASFNENDDKNIQKKEKYKKDCEDRNNARNRDTYGIVKNKGNKFNNKKLLNYDTIVSAEDNPIANPDGHNPRNLENTYIDFIESQEIKAMMKEYRDFMKTFTEVSEVLPPRQLELQEPLEPSESLETP